MTGFEDKDSLAQMVPGERRTKIRVFRIRGDLLQIETLGDLFYADVSIYMGIAEPGVN